MNAPDLNTISFNGIELPRFSQLISPIANSIISCSAHTREWFFAFTCCAGVERTALASEILSETKNGSSEEFMG
jgi:hypothetical protein